MKPVRYKRYKVVITSKFCPIEQPSTRINGRHIPTASIKIL